MAEKLVRSVSSHVAGYLQVKGRSTRHPALTVVWLFSSLYLASLRGSEPPSPTQRHHGAQGSDQRR
jgi:hypothetical protein